MTVVLYIIVSAIVFVTCVSFYFGRKEKALRGILKSSPDKCRLCGHNASIAIKHDSICDELEVSVACHGCGATISRKREDVYRAIDLFELASMLEEVISAWNGHGGNDNVEESS